MEEDVKVTIDVCVMLSVSISLLSWHYLKKNPSCAQGSHLPLFSVPMKDPYLSSSVLLVCFSVWLYYECLQHTCGEINEDV